MYKYIVTMKQREKKVIIIITTTIKFSFSFFSSQHLSFFFFLFLSFFFFLFLSIRPFLLFPIFFSFLFSFFFSLPTRRQWINLMLAFNRCSLVGETCSSGKSYTNERNSCISNTLRLTGTSIGMH